jgi:uncharacterized protein (TIGR00369 family)
MTQTTAQRERATAPAAPDGARERTFTWEDPAALANAAADLSGMEFFAAMVAGRIPPPPAMRMLGVVDISFSEGRAAFRLVPREYHCNPLGTMHGGVLATLLDSACACAVHTQLPRGHFYTSLDLSLKFLRPVTMSTGPITAEGSVIHVGRRTGLAEGRVTDATGKLYATATSSCMLIRPATP